MITRHTQHLNQLAEWATTQGVDLTLDTRAGDVWEIVQIDRQATAPKGAARAVLRRLTMEADKLGAQVILMVTGYNSALEDLYQNSGFSVDHATRDRDTGDVTMRRRPRSLPADPSPRRSQLGRH